MRLAHAAWQSAALGPIARPHVDALAGAVGKTVHLAQLDGAQVLYLDKRNARQPIEMFSAAGKVGPAYCTGVGKAMLAYLPEERLKSVLAQQSFHRFTPRTRTNVADLRSDLDAIRQRGHALDDQEHEPGIICVAHPILTRGGRVLGAISVTSSTAQETLEGLEHHLPLIRAAAGAIAADAQDWRFPDPID